MARLEGSYEQIDKRLTSLETRLETGFSEMRTEMRDFRADVDAKLNNLRTLLFSALGALALLITIFEFIN